MVRVRTKSPVKTTGKKNASRRTAKAKGQILTYQEMLQQLPADERPFVDPSGPKFHIAKDTVTLILPPPHIALNAHQGGRWHKKMIFVSALRFRAKETCKAATKLKWPAATITYAFYFADRTARDEVNAMQSLKGAIDGIVDAGLIPDDDYKHLHLAGVVCRTDPTNPRTELIFRKSTTDEIEQFHKEDL